MARCKWKGVMLTVEVQFKKNKFLIIAYMRCVFMNLVHLAQCYEKSQKLLL